MTAKRFTINTLDGSIDLRDDNKVMTYKEVVDLLNNLYEENQKLKKENVELEKFRYSIFEKMGELYEKQ